MKTKPIMSIFTVFIGLSILGSCGESSKKVTAHDIQVSPAEAKDTSSNASKVYKTKTGKMIIISETHPVGQSFSCLYQCLTHEVFIIHVVLLAFLF